MSELSVNIARNCLFSVGRAASWGMPAARAAMAATLLGALSFGLAACSATPDSVKPSAVYGDTPAADTPEGTEGFPELADTPDKRPTATSKTDQKAIADELAAERAKSRTNDETTREGAAPKGTSAPSSARMQELDKAAQQQVEAPVRVASAEVTKPVAAPAPAAAPVAAETPANVAASTTPEPAAAEMASVAAPVAPSAPEPAPVAAPAPAAVPAPVAVTSASPDLMASADAGTGVSDSTATLDTATPTSMIKDGIIPMPPRGGHKTLAEVKSQFTLLQEEEEARARAADAAAAAPDEAKPAPDEPYVGSAPTQKVIVEPTGASQP